MALMAGFFTGGSLQLPTERRKTLSLGVVCISCLHPFQVSVKVERWRCEGNSNYDILLPEYEPVSFYSPALKKLFGV